MVRKPEKHKYNILKKWIFQKLGKREKEATKTLVKCIEGLYVQQTCKCG